MWRSTWATAIAHLHDGSAVEMDVALVDVNGPKGGEDKACRVTFHSPNFRTLRVEERGADIYACVAAVRDRLVRLVNRELEQLRQVDRVGDPGASAGRPEGEEVSAPMESAPDLKSGWATGRPRNRVRRLPTSSQESYKPTVPSPLGSRRMSMARLKFVLFALVAVAVAGYHLLAISPLVSARAQALAAETARTAASAVRGEVERQKTQLASATLAARTSTGC